MSREPSSGTPHISPSGLSNVFFPTMISRTTATVTIPLFAWVVLMLTVSSVPGDSLPNPGFFGWDKIAHFVEYFVLGVLLWRFVRARCGSDRIRSAAIALGAGLAYGAFDELHQILIPLRSCSIFDFAVDALGVAAGIAAMWLMRPRS